MFTKKFVRIYSVLVQLLMVLTMFQAAPVDWDMKRKKVVRTHGMSNFLFWCIFIAMWCIFFAVLIRTLIRITSNQLWDPMTTAATISVYCGGLGAICIALFELLVRDCRDDLAEFANQVITLDKRLQKLYKREVMSDASRKAYIMKKQRKEEHFMGLLVGIVLYCTGMFSMFVFVELDMLNRFFRYYFGLTPRLSVAYLPLCCMNGVGSAIVFWTITLFAGTYILFVSSSTTWLSVCSTTQPQLKAGDGGEGEGLSEYNYGKDKRKLVKMILKKTEGLRIFKAFQVLVAIGNDITKRKFVTFHHQMIHMVISILTFSYLKHVEYHSVASIIGFPATVGILNLLEYKEVHLLSKASDVSAAFVKGMKEGLLGGSCSNKKLWFKELRVLKPITVEVYYPIRQTDRKCYSHFVLVFSLNTTDLLLAFK